MVALTQTEAKPRPGFALFEYGFRPFFLLVGLHGAVMVPAWLAVLYGATQLPDAIPPLFWHAHQMVYGFAAAGLAGFMLTAVPSWTGAPARRGVPLIGLVLLWLAGRIVMTFPGPLPAWAAAIVDLAFLPALAFAIAGPLVASGKRRNLMLLVPLTLFWAGDAMMQAQFLGLADDTAMTGARLGIDVMLLMIAVIGGRIVPTFTANVLRASGISFEPRRVPLFDIGSIGSIALLLVSEAATGTGLVTGAAALVAAVLNGIRLSGWGGQRTLKNPLLWVLHLGYAWLVIGLLLKAAAAIDVVPDAAALHTLTIGAIGTMLVAVMSRAALGHTGRPLRAHPVTVAAYALVSAAALLRIAATELPDIYCALLAGSGIAWTGGFVLFLWIYTPVLATSRPDGHDG